ncbi:MAG: glucokinase [Rhodospirillum sp.]|nr:glucokinase [Rhodospirillum sp.]MCF8489753.1 glucokinase [Rhodospirillum sp.]MCF8502471.1 glucokinase [Rhodospirillum sp.]
MASPSPSPSASSPTRPQGAPALLADIGGTNVRFALIASEGQWGEERVYPIAHFPGPGEAAEAYLAEVLLPGDPRPDKGAFCVACPVLGDDVALTNHEAWSFSIERLGARLGLSPLRVVNDFVAQALAVPALPPNHRVLLWEGASLAGSPIGVIGPGTGLGVAVLAPDGAGGHIVLPGEGGHVSLAPMTPREDALIATARERLGHVSAERFLSGPGLQTLAATIRIQDGLPPREETPGDIMTEGLAGTCPVRAETVSLFFAMLGTVAGNLALSIGAMGGIYLMGGIVPRVPDALAASAFVERVQAKGRFRAYMERIPLVLGTHPYPAFLGLAHLLGKA